MLVGSEKGHQSGDLRGGLLGRAGDVVEGGSGQSRVTGGELVTGVGLDDHRAEAVRHDVVQLTRNPDPLGAHRLLGEALLGKRQLASLRLQHRAGSGAVVGDQPYRAGARRERIEQRIDG